MCLHGRTTQLRCNDLLARVAVPRGSLSLRTRRYHLQGDIPHHDGSATRHMAVLQQAHCGAAAALKRVNGPHSRTADDSYTQHLHMQRSLRHKYGTKPRARPGPRQRQAASKLWARNTTCVLLHAGAFARLGAHKHRPSYPMHAQGKGRVVASLAHPQRGNPGDQPWPKRAPTPSHQRGSPAQHRATEYLRGSQNAKR